MPLVLLDLRWSVSMSPVVERLLTVAVTAAVTTGLSALGYSGAIQSGEASKSAQDQCCPLARTCVEGLVNGH